MHRPHSQNSLDQLASPPGETADRPGHKADPSPMQDQKIKEKWRKMEKKLKFLPCSYDINGPSYFKFTAWLTRNLYCPEQLQYMRKINLRMIVQISMLIKCFSWVLQLLKQPTSINKRYRIHCRHCNQSLAQTVQGIQSYPPPPLKFRLKMSQGIACLEHTECLTLCLHTTLPRIL